MHRFRFLLLVTALVGLALAPATASAGITAWGERRGNDGELFGPQGIATSPAGDVYVADPGSNRIHRFDNRGRLLGRWGERGEGPGRFQALEDVAADATSVYAVDRINNKVSRFTPEGKLLREWAVERGDDLAVGPRGEVLVTTGGDDPAVRTYSPDGVLLRELASDAPYGTMGLAADDRGDLYLGQHSRDRPSVRKLRPDGTVLWEIQSANGEPFRELRSLTTDRAGNVFVVEATRVHRFGAADGRFVATYVGGPGPAPGQFEWGRDVAADADGNVFVAEGGAYYGEGGSQIHRFETRIPVAALEAAPSPVSTGAPVTFDAAGSFSPLSRIERFEWDLDGDGIFELDAGARPQASRAFPEPGRRTARVRVTETGGGTAVATTDLEVRLAPPPGPRGVSINGGAQFTRDPLVTVVVRWPALATDLFVSNDGGFGTFGSFGVAPAVPWRLDTTGPERLPKTIYVRFAGGESGNETYQDDIVLDQTSPQLESATATAPAARRSAVQLKLRAQDAGSGIAAMQVARTPRAAPAFVPFRSVSRQRISRKRGVYVRLQDRVGNTSKWRRVKVRCARGKRCR